MLTSGYNLAQFWVAAETERHDVIVVLQVEGLCLCEGIVDYTSSGCVVQDAPIRGEVDILTSVESSITKYVVQRQVLAQREQHKVTPINTSRKSGSNVTSLRCRYSRIGYRLSPPIPSILNRMNEWVLLSFNLICAPTSDSFVQNFNVYHTLPIPELCTLAKNDISTNQLMGGTEELLTVTCTFSSLVTTFSELWSARLILPRPLAPPFSSLVSCL